MHDIRIGKTRHRMRNRAEIVDDRIAIDAEPVLDQRRTDDPRTVGHLEHLAADRPGEGDRKLVGKIAARPPAELLPGELEAAVLRRLERDRLAELNDLAAVDGGEREASVGPADVSRRDLPHA